jgi:hypothetical protein
MFIQPAGEKKPCLIDWDCISFHQSIRCPRVLAFEEPLFNVIRQLKRMHRNFCSYGVLTQKHHIPTVAKPHHWSKLVPDDVTTGASAYVGDFHDSQDDSSPTTASSSPRRCRLEGCRPQRSSFTCGDTVLSGRSRLTRDPAKSDTLPSAAVYVGAYQLRGKIPVQPEHRAIASRA